MQGFASSASSVGALTIMRNEWGERAKDQSDCELLYEDVLLERIGQIS